MHILLNYQTNDGHWDIRVPHANSFSLQSVDCSHPTCTPLLHSSSNLPAHQISIPSSSCQLANTILSALHAMKAINPQAAVAALAASRSSASTATPSSFFKLGSRFITWNYQDIPRQLTQYCGCGWVLSGEPIHCAMAELTILLMSHTFL